MASQEDQADTPQVPAPDDASSPWHDKAAVWAEGGREPSGETEPTSESAPDSSLPEPSSPEAPAAPVSAAPTSPRPRPQFGEYAPEGWAWKPEGDAESGDATTGSGGPVSPTLPGVPHNLGAGSALPPRGGQASMTKHARSDARQKPQAPAHQAAPASTASISRPAVKTPRPADKVITILLLAIGAVGALQFSLAMMSIEKTFALMGNAPGVDSFTPPSWLGTTGNVIGLAVLAIYGVMLVYTIRRLRAGKLSFWVPLATGAVVSVTIIATVFIAMLNSPGLTSIVTDPDQTAKLLEYIQTMGQ